MGGHEKQTEVHDSLYKLAQETSKNYFIDGPLFDHMTIKQAKEKADELGRWLIRFAMDYHNSMSVAKGVDDAAHQGAGEP